MSEEFSLRPLIEEQKKNKRKETKLALKRERERKAKSRRNKLIAFLVFSMILAIFMYWFANNYYIRTPVLVQNPIVKKEVREYVVLSPLAVDGTADTLTDMEIIKQYRFSPILKGIYMLESTFGQNDSCKEQGKFNGFGYRQNERENKCYESFGQVTEIVNDWLEERLATNGNNLAEALCYYNTGYAGQDSCKYFQNFMTILVDNL